MTKTNDGLGVDTNVLLATVRPDEPQHTQAQDVLEQLRSAGNRLVISHQVIAEFWSVSTRPRSARNGLGFSVLRAENALRVFEAQFDVLTERPETYRIWKDLVTRYGVIGASVHDARFVATMVAHDVSRLLTFDTDDFARYAEISVIDPASFV